MTLVKFAARKVGTAVVVLAEGVVEFQLTPEDEGRGAIGVVKVVSSLMATVVALPVMLPVTGVHVPLEGSAGGVPEGVLVSLRVAGIDGVGVEMVAFAHDTESGVDEADPVVPVGVLTDVAFTPEIVGFDDLVL